MKSYLTSTTSLLIMLILGIGIGLGVTSASFTKKPIGFVKGPVAEPKKLQFVEVLHGLDSDGNGLYDDRERKAMLGVLQSISPEIKGNFDANGDGKVSVVEQTTGRHPLSQLTNSDRVVSSSKKIPWSPNIYPEWISTSALQEDASANLLKDRPITKVPAKISHLPNRGTVNLDGFSQKLAAKQPHVVVNRGGISFAANSGQHLSMDVQKDARWNYRWLLFTFRINELSGSGENTVLLDINNYGSADGGARAGYSSPKIWFNKTSGLNIEFLGAGQNGLDRRLVTTNDIYRDGQNWNVVVVGMRYGRMYASVNGRDISIEQPDYFAAPSVYQGTSFIGSTQSDNSAWALDALLLGTTEPSEAMVDKLSGWAAHRLGMQFKLPKNHPYTSQRPVLDEEDHPHRYVHDNSAWRTWGNSLKNKTFKQRNAGKKPVTTGTFERVFFDDFRANRISRSFASDGNLWQAPGFNTAVGHSIPLALPDTSPNVYAHDATTQKQTLSIAPKGDSWVGSAFYSVNDMGHGYTWEGPKIFRLRGMFPNIPQDALAPGLFPAFWSYGTEWLFWRTSNRIEVDWFEFDGKNGHWLNGLSSHLHYSHLTDNIYAKDNQSYQNYKVYGDALTEKKSKIPGGLYFWDGEYHTWEFVIDNQMTYINVTVQDEQGNEQWVEVARSKTAPSFLERLDIQFDYALKQAASGPKTEQTFVLDFVEVLQKTEQISAWAKPFSAAPQIVGKAAVGSTLSCNANLLGVTDIRYYWFANGYPLTYSSNPNYTLSTAEKGTEIRCMVKAVGARNMPEAWSAKRNVL